MDHTALSQVSAVVLLVVRDGVVEGCGAYAPGCVPVTVVATSDRCADGERLRAALASLPHEPARVA